jgi:hypothetical protein
MVWTATVSCDHEGCKAQTTAEIEVSSFHVGRISVRSVAGKGWSVPSSDLGRAICPKHAQPAKSSTRATSRGGGAHVHREGHCDTSNCIEARRGDSRFYTISGQLIPPPGR